MFSAKTFPGTTRFTGHKGGVYTLCAAREQGHFLSGSGDGSVVRWNLKEPETGITEARIGRAIFALQRKDHLLFIGDEDGGLHVTDLVTRQEIQLERAHVKGIFAIVELPGDRLAVAAGDGSLSIWKQGADARLSLQRKIPLADEKLRGLALNADASLIAVACADGSIRILDTTDLNEHFTLPGHDKGANCVAWHPTKPVLVSGGKDGHLRTWRSDADFQPLHAFPAHKDTIYHLAFSPDGMRCATASRDKSAKVWDANSFEMLRRLDRSAGGHGYSVDDLLWMGSRTLLTSSDDKTIVEWEVG